LSFITYLLLLLLTKVLRSAEALHSGTLGHLAAVLCAATFIISPFTETYAIIHDAITILFVTEAVVLVVPVDVNCEVSFQISNDLRLCFNSQKGFCSAG